jgi:hypothetical protein
MEMDLGVTMLEEWRNGGMWARSGGDVSRERGE